MFNLHFIATPGAAGGRIALCDDRSESLVLAEQLLAEMRNSGQATSDSVITVLADGETAPIASFTENRIIGTFTKQVWAGRKGDDAMFVGNQDFDATDYVLRMSVSDIHELADHDQSTDEIATAHVDHDGPFEVELTNRICAYFGIEQLADLSEEHLHFVCKGSHAARG